MGFHGRGAYNQHREHQPCAAIMWATEVANNDEDMPNSSRTDGSPNLLLQETMEGKYFHLKVT